MQPPFGGRTIRVRILFPFIAEKQKCQKSRRKSTGQYPQRLTTDEVTHRICRDERNNTFHELEPIHPEMAVLVPILSWPAKRFQFCHRFTCVLISIQVQFQPRSFRVRAASIYSANPCFPNKYAKIRFTTPDPRIRSKFVMAFPAIPDLSWFSW